MKYVAAFLILFSLVCFMGCGRADDNERQINNNSENDTGEETNIIPENSGVGQSRNNPAPIGSRLVYNGNNYWTDEYYKFRITLIQIIRGVGAWDLIYKANKFNDKPNTGYEYILAEIKFEFSESSEEDSQYKLRGFDFTVVSSDGVDYDDLFIVEPDPDLNADMYAGSATQGWAAFEVKIGDAHPLLTFGRDYEGSGGIWFELYHN